MLSFMGEHIKNKKKVPFRGTISCSQTQTVAVFFWEFFSQKDTQRRSKNFKDWCRPLLKMYVSERRFISWKHQNYLLFYYNVSLIGMVGLPELILENKKWHCCCYFICWWFSYLSFYCTDQMCSDPMWSVLHGPVAAGDSRTWGGQEENRPTALSCCFIKLFLIFCKTTARCQQVLVGFGVFSRYHCDTIWKLEVKFGKFHT